MEKKLAEYRAKKAREAKMTEIKTQTKNFIARLLPAGQKSTLEEEVLVAPEAHEVVAEPLEDASSVCSDEEGGIRCSLVDLLYYLLWFVLWVILYWIFIKLQFGTVFLICSGIVFMFVNTRTGPRRTGEVSAYSVFNQNCESIDGTLKAEQFEREIRYGHAAVN